MEWYFIVLIAIGAVVGLFLLVYFLGKLLRPKFKHKKKEQLPTEPKANSTPIVSSSVGPMVGLSLDNKLKLEEDSVFDELKKSPPAPPKRTLDSMGFEDFKKKLKSKQQKPLAEQIRELSPELKILLLDRGLARKDYEIKSKKD